MDETRSFSPGRRQVFRYAAAALGASCFPSLGCWPHKPVAVWPKSPEVSFPDGPLTIDAHCHVFNGTDLRVREFISMVAVRQGGALGEAAKVLGSLLQSLTWLAPTGEEELVELERIARELSDASDGRAMTNAMAQGLSRTRQKGYARGRAQLREVLRSSDEFQALQLRARRSPQQLDQESITKVDAINYIDELPEDVEQYRRWADRDENFARFSLRGRSIRGFIDFLLQNFQYRYVSVHDYLRDYNQPGTRVVDLMLPSLVDFDWWLAKGEPTTTSLRRQVDVMRQIAIVTGGRVHAFMPYDPLREVAFELGYAAADSFSLVTDAIENQGFVGVKLYPPMGFAALGNADLKGLIDTNFWARKWLPTWTDQADLGRKLDSAMTKMLSWCVDRGVPVMAHTNISNGVADDFEALAGSEYWAKALKAFPALRVSFGHFGGGSSQEHGLARARAFAQLMTADGQGVSAYADSGFFVEVIQERPALLETLRTLYVDTADKEGAALANRFMYGTDWEMTLTHGSVNRYLADFIELFKELEPRAEFRAARLTDLSGKFLGTNAVDWIGLRKDGKARIRLDDFYKKHRVPTPDWMDKVDKLGASRR